MIHRLTLRDPCIPGWPVRKGPRPWCFTCDNPDCTERRQGQPDFYLEGGTRRRAIWAARRQGWHVSRYGVACPLCMEIWDELMMSEAHRDLSLNPRQTPDPHLTNNHYRLIRHTPRQT